MIKQEMLYEVISWHLKDGSFLVLQCSELVDVDFSIEWLGIFFTQLTRSVDRVNLATTTAQN